MCLILLDRTLAQVRARRRIPQQGCLSQAVTTLADRIGARRESGGFRSGKKPKAVEASDRSSFCHSTMRRYEKRFRCGNEAQAFYLSGQA